MVDIYLTTSLRNRLHHNAAFKKWRLWVIVLKCRIILVIVLVVVHELFREKFFNLAIMYLVQLPITCDQPPTKDGRIKLSFSGGQSKQSCFLNYFGF